MRWRVLGLSIPMVCSSLAVSRAVHAAPPWVDRYLTLPAGDWAFDFGLGLGHAPGPDESGVGVNAEMAVGLTDRVELGVRTGLRFGGEAERAIEPDNYGRFFDRQYFDGDGDPVANPEVRVRGALVREEVVELALEGRLIVPVEGNTAGAMFGVPLAFHFGRRVRLDTGAYVPIVFGDDRGPTTAAIDLPLDVWIQASPRLWLGPMTGLVFSNLGNPPSHLSASIGFGLGYQITRYLDFKTMLLFPRVTDAGDAGATFGLGAGIEIRIE